jgi:hypothetical protein
MGPAGQGRLAEKGTEVKDDLPTEQFAPQPGPPGRSGADTPFWRFLVLLPFW